MAIFKRKPEPRLSRREMAASRRVSSGATESVSNQTFRRSRTISSKRPDVGSSERQTTRDLRTRRRKVLYRLSVTLLSIGGIVLILSQLTASVRVVAPNQSQITQEVSERYQGVLDGYLSSRPLERLRFMLNKAELNAYMLEHAPEVQSAEVVYGGQVASSDLMLSFRQPALQWVASGKKYYVDGQGVTYEINYFAEPAISVEDQSGVEPDVGQAVVNHRFLGFLGQVSAQLQSEGVTVSRVILPENTVRQVDFGIEGRPYVIRMTVDRGVAEQASRAVKSMSFLDANSITPTYIDARVDQRVFYR